MSEFCSNCKKLQESLDKAEQEIRSKISKEEIKSIAQEVERITMSTMLNTSKLLAETIPSEEIVDDYINDMIIFISICYKKKILDVTAFYGCYLFLLLVSGPIHLISNELAVNTASVVKSMIENKVISESNAYKFNYLLEYRKQHEKNKLEANNESDSK
jgi:hypothetical protein